MLGKVARLAQTHGFDLSPTRPSVCRNLPGFRIDFAGTSKFGSFPDLASLVIRSPGLKHLMLRTIVIHESTLKLDDTLRLPVVHLKHLRIDRVPCPSLGFCISHRGRPPLPAPSKPAIQVRHLRADQPFCTSNCPNLDLRITKVEFIKFTSRGNILK